MRVRIIYIYARGEIMTNVKAFEIVTKWNISQINNFNSNHHIKYHQNVWVAISPRAYYRKIIIIHCVVE